MLMLRLVCRPWPNWPLQVSVTEFSTHFDVAGVTFVELVKRAIANGGDGVRRAFARHPLYALVKLTKSQVCVCSITGIPPTAPRAVFTPVVPLLGVSHSCWSEWATWTTTCRL